jgi:hypothetical protein
VAWSRVQSAATAATASAVTSASVTYGSNVSAGTKLIAVVVTSTQTGTTTTTASVKDAALNSWTLIGRKSGGASPVLVDVSLWALDTPAGDVGAKPALTAALSGGTANIAILIQEVSGLLAGNTAAMADGNPAGLSGAATGTTGSPAYSSTAASEYLVSAYGDDGGPVTWTKPAALTSDTASLNSQPYAGIALAYGNSTGGAEAGSWSLAGSAAEWGTLLAAFRLPAVLPGTASLSGSGTLAGTGAFQGTAALSGSGTLSGTGTSTGFGGGGVLSGTGTLGGTVTGTFLYTATISGTGALSAAGTAVLVFTGGASTYAATYAATYPGTPGPPVFSGSGTLSLSGVVLKFPAALAGQGTLAVLSSGGLVFASPGAATPQAYPLSSQVAVAPVNTAQWQYLGTLGTVTALTYSFTCPGGCDKMTATIMVPAAYRTSLFNPGWRVQVTRGGHVVWTGKMDEPVPTSSGWNLTASGDGNRGTDFLAIFDHAWPSGEPDEAVNRAIAYGMPWVNPGIGNPPGAWFGQAVDTGAQTITAMLNLICTRGGLTWYVNSQPGGVPGSHLSVFPLPSVPSRLLVASTPVARTLGGDINTIWLRYEVTADNSTTGATASYAIAFVQNTASALAHGPIETYIDLSSAGVMTQAAAQAVGSYVLSIYQRASFAGPFTARYGQLTTTGGAPVDPGTDQAGTVCKLILTDFGYGGEVTPQFPVQFIVGSYSWDDLAQVATITPYQAIDQSLTGMLSLENTVLTPVAAAGP